MPKILLDGSELTVTPAPLTWGGALRAVDGHLADTGRIVTDIRIDGLDEPAFREPDALERPLDEVFLLEIQSGTPNALLDRCLEEALSAIPPLCAAALGIAHDYRRHHRGDANAGLAELAEGLTSLVGIVGAAGLAFQVDLRNLRCGDQMASSVVSELGAYLDALVTAQEAGDWVTVADVLQFDVEPTLKRIAPVLESLRQDQTAA